MAQTSSTVSDRHASARARPVRRRLSVELAPILGRDAELHALSDSVQSGADRLITLVGPAGVGKSRLAASVVSQLTHAFPHGSHLVDLAAAHQIHDVVAALSAVVAPPAETVGGPASVAWLAATLRNRALLIVLDNCEHVRAELAELAVKLVAECAGLQLLVASGEPLGVYGEQLFAVRPLETPDPAVEMRVEDLARVPSVALFLHRGAAVRPTFALTVDNAHAVAELCRQLDGLPLAIELAASRLKILHPQSLLAKLRDGLDVLENLGLATPARYRSMRAVLSAVCERLPEDARTLLATLGVFTSTFSLEAVEAVSGLPADVACVHLELLIDRSIVLSDDKSPHELRFSLLRTTRTFALERLRAAGTVDEVRHRHADYLVARIAKRATGGTESVDEQWLAALEREHDDIMATLAYLVDERRGHDATALATGLVPHWLATGQPRVGLRWLSRTIEAANGAPGQVIADSLRAAGELAARCGASGDALDLHRRALAGYRAAGDATGVAATTHQLGVAAYLAGDLPQARRFLEQAAHLVGNDKVAHAAVLLDLAALGVAEDDPQPAAEYAASALAQLEAAAHAGGIALARTRQAEVAVARGQFADAEAHCQAAMPDLAKLRSWDALAGCWELLAAVMTDDGSGRIERAAQLLSAARACRERYGQPGAAGRQPVVRRLVDRVRHQLGPMMFAEAWHRGRALPVQAVAGGTGPGVATRQPTLDLTPRQRQVAELVASGLTNREIAKKLGVAEWTAVNHVRQVLRKLKCSSRVQVARWFFQQEHPR